jgi:protein SCO1/2
MIAFLLLFQQEVGIDQRLNEPIPSSLSFFDESGRRVRLDDYLGRTPIVLTLVYLRCPMLCRQVLQGLRRSLRSLSLVQGRDYEVLAVSFDPEETLARAAQYRAEFGWTFLTGDEDAIRRLATAVGFRYRQDSATGEFAHAAAIMIVTPEGRLARYHMGIDYPARDLRLSMVEASEGKVGSAADRLLLLCYAYDPSTGRYSMAVLGVLRMAAVMTAVGLCALILVFLRRERRRRHAA